MAQQIDTSIFNTRPTTTAQGLSSLASGFQSIKDAKMNDLAFQQRQIQLQAIKDKQARDAAFRQDFQDMGYTQGISDPRELQDLYTEHYPEQVAQQQMQQSLKTPSGSQWQMSTQRPGWSMNKTTGEWRKNETVFGDIDPYKQAKLSQGKSRIENMKKRQTFAEKMGNFKEAKAYRDEIFREKKLILDEEERDWNRDWSRNKTPYEYGQKQEQLKGQIPSVVRDNYRGTIVEGAQGAQDLTPQAVKDITGATEGASKILRSTNKIIDMVNDEGLALLPGKRKAKMETLISDMALTYKGVDFAGLGVLTGPDLDILLNIMGDPTSFAGLSADIQNEKLNEFRDLLLAGYNKKLDTRGINPLTPEQISSFGGKKATLTAEDEALID